MLCFNSFKYPSDRWTMRLRVSWQPPWATSRGRTQRRTPASLPGWQFPRTRRWTGKLWAQSPALCPRLNLNRQLMAILKSTFYQLQHWHWITGWKNFFISHSTHDSQGRRWFWIGVWRFGGTVSLAWYVLPSISLSRTTTLPCFIFRNRCRRQQWRGRQPRPWAVSF